MDLTLFRLINGLAGQSPVMDELFRFFANDYIVPSILVALLVVGWFSRKPAWRQIVLHALLALLLANAIVKVCNLIWFRPRPFTYHDVHMLFYYPSDSSFPSNSAAVVWSLAFVMWLGLPKTSRFGYLALFFAAIMGWSRIWVGVHYPFDIVGGALVGWLAAWWVKRHETRLYPMERGLEWVARKIALA